MTKNHDEEGIQAVRDVRTKISEEHANDPERIVEHYRLEQERYKERLLQAPKGNLTNKASDV